MIAMMAGTALALLALGYVLYPLLAGGKPGEASASGSTCPKCGEIAGADASFCANCGSPVVVL